MRALFFLFMAFADETTLLHLWDKMKDKMYPVGSIYLSTNDTSPADIFGGTWERIKDRFLLAAGDTYTAGSTGGAATHNHKYGFQYGAYYGAICIELDPNTGVLKDGTGDPVGASFAKQQDAIVNNSAANGSSNKSVSHYRSISDTSAASNMPPYMAVYMWKRTA